MDEEYDDYYEDEEYQEEEAGFGFFIHEQMQYLPWWAISAVLHLIIVCITMLVIIERPFKKEEREIQTGLVNPEQIEEEQIEQTEPEPETSVKQANPEEPKVKDPVVKPDAQVADHTESANEQESHQQMGKEDYVTSSPLNSKMNRSEIGVGGNAGGTFGGRIGGKYNLVQKYGGSKATEDAVHAGLLWLKKHQNPDGSWSSTGFCNTCDGDGWAGYDVGITGLALLCFLGAGNTTKIGEFKDVVKKGTKYLRSVQGEDGCFGEKRERYMYNHAIATLAMAEAYALSNYFPLLRDCAQKGVDYLVDAQNPGMAWRYTHKCNDNDSSVTGWCVMALKSAKVAGLNVPPNAFDGATTFLNLVTDEYYRTGYMKNMPGSVVTGEKGFAYSPSLTAVGMTARVFMGTNPQSPYLTQGADLLLKQLPIWGQDANNKCAIDFYYWYYGTLAMFQVGGSNWKQWNEQLKPALLDHQEKSGCPKGSWPPAGKWCSGGGRVYSTALSVLSLEIYYRYDKVFK